MNRSICECRILNMENLQILPAAQLVEMMVPLYSHGCANKIHKALISHHKGIYSVNVNYDEQKVTVWGICNKHQVLSTVRTKRKAARFWNNDDDDNDDSQRHVEEKEEEDRGRLPHPPRNSLIRPSFALNKFRSLSFKLACKKVFTTARSYSFRSIKLPL